MTLEQLMTFDQIDQAIDQYIRQDPVRAFHNLNCNIIMHALNRSVAGSVAAANAGSRQEVNSSNFDSPTHCMLAPVFAGQNISVFYDELNRHLRKGELPGDPTEVSIDPAGGFEVLLPAFDATTGNHHFVASITI